VRVKTSKKKKKNAFFNKKKVNFTVSVEQLKKNFTMSTELKTSENSVIGALGLDYNYNITKMAGKNWTPKDGLKVYFLTVRLRVDFSHENALELVASLKAHKRRRSFIPPHAPL